MTPEQLHCFLKVVHPRHRLLFKLLATSGLRISEALALQWKHVTLGARPSIQVRRAIVRRRVHPPKSKHGRRTVPLSHKLAEDLVSTRGLAGPDDLLFSSRAGTPLLPENMRRRVLKPAAEEADASWAGFHTFRHTCASMLFARGANAVQVQRWLGHHSPAFTLATYVHLLRDDLGDPIALEEELRPSVRRYVDRAPSSTVLAP